MDLDSAFWGNATAVGDSAEPNFEHFHCVAEPICLLTQLAWFSGLYNFFTLRQPIRWAFAAQVSIGLFGSLYHASLWRSFQILDRTAVLLWVQAFGFQAHRINLTVDGHYDRLRMTGGSDALRKDELRRKLVYLVVLLLGCPGQFWIDPLYEVGFLGMLAWTIWQCWKVSLLFPQYGAALHSALAITAPALACFPGDWTSDLHNFYYFHPLWHLFAFAATWQAMIFIQCGQVHLVRMQKLPSSTLDQKLCRAGSTLGFYTHVINEQDTFKQIQ